MWLDVRLDADTAYRIGFRLAFADGARTSHVAVLVRSGDDDGAPRNEWGVMSRSPELGRFRYAPAAGEDGLHSFRIKGPSSGTLRLGLRSWRPQGSIEAAAQVLVERLGDAGGVYMSPDEAAMLRRYLASASSYLEFGSGGSTEAAVEAGVQRIVSVEADQAWLDRLRQHPAMTEAESKGLIVFHHADIGATGLHSFPKSKTPGPRWDDYWLGAWSHFKEPPDLVLVDGRFRAACAIASLIACPPQTPVLVHDYGSDARRESYAALTVLADIAERAGTLVCFKKREDFSALAALKLLSLHRHDVW